jgi:hypothetical protein
MKLLCRLGQTLAWPRDEWNALERRMKERDKLNLVTDSRIIVLSDNDFEQLCRSNQIDYDCYDINRDRYAEWAQSIQKILPAKLRDLNIGIDHKKLIEFYVSFSLLEPIDTDILMDMAGQNSLFLRIVNHSVPVKKLILQDILVREKSQTHFRIIESDASNIPLPDASVSKIAVHHSFEHFRGNSDIHALREIQRLLMVDGFCVIVPLFLSTKYWEVFNTDSVTQYDQEAEVIVDKFSTFPGWGKGEAFARIYSPDAFEKRVLASIDRSSFQVSALKVTMNGCSVPDMDINIGTHVNYPMRVLKLKKKKPT